MTLSYEEHILLEIKTTEHKLFKRTASLYDELTIVDNKFLPMVDIRLAEMFTLKNTLYTLVFTHSELYSSTDFIDLLKTWNNIYKQMKSVVVNNDSNTSWMANAFHRYSVQHQLIQEFLHTFDKHISE